MAHNESAGIVAEVHRIERQAAYERPLLHREPAWDEVVDLAVAVGFLVIVFGLVVLL